MDCTCIIVFMTPGGSHFILCENILRTKEVQPRPRPDNINVLVCGSGGCRGGDYSPGLEAAFSSLAEGMAGCFEAALPGGPVAGNVTWTGSGVWAARARAVCVDLDTQSWCCEMESGTAPQNEPVTLGNCDQEQLL